MPSFNKIILIGRVVKTPDLRYTPQNTPVATFTLAVDRRKSPDKEEKETDFIDIVTWEKTAEICSRQLSKGRLVAVEGRLQIRSYEAQDGTRRKVAEVVANNVQFLDWPTEKLAEAGFEQEIEGIEPSEEISLDSSYTDLDKGEDYD
jgi:single-strand DNA-binding protein